MISSLSYGGRFNPRGRLAPGYYFPAPTDQTVSFPGPAYYKQARISSSEPNCAFVSGYSVPSFSQHQAVTLGRGFSTYPLRGSFVVLRWSLTPFPSHLLPRSLSPPGWEPLPPLKDPGIHFLGGTGEYLRGRLLNFRYVPVWKSIEIILYCCTKSDIRIGPALVRKKWFDTLLLLFWHPIFVSELVANSRGATSLDGTTLGRRYCWFWCNSRT